MLKAEFISDMMQIMLPEIGCVRLDLRKAQFEPNEYPYTIRL